MATGQNNVDKSSSTMMRVRLEVYATHLKNVAGLFGGTSDPFCVVSVIPNRPDQDPEVLGKTEVIENTLNPRWVHAFELDYNLGLLTRLRLAIFDEVKANDFKLMGTADFEVGAILGARGNVKARRLHKGGTVFARITAAPEKSAGTLKLTLKGTKLTNVEGGIFGGLSDPFFECCSQVDLAGGREWQPVYRSEAVKDSLDPEWETAYIDMNRLCDGDLFKPILFKFWDRESSGKHTPMGKFETNLLGLQEAASKGPDGAFIPINKGKPSGKVLVLSAEIEGADNNGARNEQHATRGFGSDQSSNTSSHTPEPFQPQGPPSQAPPSEAATASAPKSSRYKPAFVDYLYGGCELELCIAIDFTSSNGDPRVPGSLHYLSGGGELNDYEKAIFAVGGIISLYDSDSLFPVWGFGAKYEGVLRNFFLVGNAPELFGIAGVMEGYRDVFSTGLVMSGPTSFVEVIAHAATSARNKQEEAHARGGQAYKILLILTNGGLDDVEVEKTRRAIINASDAPLSIVVVGIGNRDFSSLQFLDDFASENGTRDICQFVEFARHGHDKSLLAQATLEEIPSQLVEYFFGRGIMPLPPVVTKDVNESEAMDDIDLGVEVNAQGEISMTGLTAGTVYDDTTYGNFGRR